MQSGILSQFPEIDLSTNKIGIFSRPIKLTDVLKEGDRIEIYRPLLADPKEIAVNVQQSKLQPKTKKKELKMTALSSVDFCLPEHITPEIFLRDYWQKSHL